MSSSLSIYTPSFYAAMNRITLSSQNFIDTLGRTRVFHGTNAIVKGPPWYPDYKSFSNDISMAKEDFEIMQKMGNNVLRLGMMWPGVEPSQGEYDEEYLDHISNIVEMAASYGVYTLLDMHQDGLSEFMCGEGLPTWAVRHTEDFDADKHAYPWPFDSPITDLYKEDKLSGSPMLPTRDACNNKNQGPGWHEPTLASADAYQAFYDNVDGMLDSWAEMWKVSARELQTDKEYHLPELIVLFVTRFAGRSTSQSRARCR